MVLCCFAVFGFWHMCGPVLTHAAWYYLLTRSCGSLLLRCVRFLTYNGTCADLMCGIYWLIHAWVLSYSVFCWFSHLCVDLCWPDVWYLLTRFSIYATMFSAAFLTYVWTSGKLRFGCVFPTRSCGSVLLCFLLLFWPMCRPVLTCVDRCWPKTGYLLTRSCDSVLLCFLLLFWCVDLRWPDTWYLLTRSSVVFVLWPALYGSELTCCVVLCWILATATADNLCTSQIVAYKRPWIHSIFSSKTKELKSEKKRTWQKMIFFPFLM